MWSKWSKGLKRLKFCHWAPIMASRCVRPHKVPIRPGFGIPDALGYNPPREGSLVGKGWCLPCSWGCGKKCCYPSKKVLFKMLLRGTALKNSIHSEGPTQYMHHWEKKRRGVYDPRETKGSVQDLVAASCPCRMDCIQMPKVCPNNSLVQPAERLAC